MANPQTIASRSRALLVALLAILAVAACQGTPTETTTTWLDTTSAPSQVSRT